MSSFDHEPLHLPSAARQARFRQWQQRCTTLHMLCAIGLAVLTVSFWGWWFFQGDTTTAYGFVMFGLALLGWLLLPVHRIARAVASADARVRRHR